MVHFAGQGCNLKGRPRGTLAEVRMAVVRAQVWDWTASVRSGAGTATGMYGNEGQEGRECARRCCCNGSVLRGGQGRDAGAGAH